MGEPYQIHDADALQSLKKQWVSIVGTIFNNVTPIGSHVKLDGIYSQYFRL